MSCKLNLRRFPHDIQKCTLELESCKFIFMTVLDLMSLSLSYLNSPFHCLERVTATPRFHKGRKGVAKFVRYNEASLYRGSFPYILHRSLQRGLRYLEVRYIEVPLCYI